MYSYNNACSYMYMQKTYSYLASLNVWLAYSYISYYLLLFDHVVLLQQNFQNGQWN